VPPHFWGKPTVQWVSKFSHVVAAPFSGFAYLQSVAATRLGGSVVILSSGSHRWLLKYRHYVP